ncbi:MAG: GspH/FimT family pseudopilin [Meiothermus sp.]|nr:GspH/FimT family pseudopilin [Meiothermus sp.]
MKHSQGLSLVEILVVLAILGVLLSLSVRFVGTSAELGRAASEIEQLISKTRFEAIKRNRSVVLEFSSAQVKVYVDHNANKTRDTGEPVLEGWRSVEYRRGVRLTEINLGGGHLMVWSPEGRGSSASDGSVAGRLRLIDDSGATREVSISVGGYTN